MFKYVIILFNFSDVWELEIVSDNLNFVGHLVAPSQIFYDANRPMSNTITNSIYMVSMYWHKF